MTSSTGDRRRKRAVIALVGMAAAALVGLVNGLASCAPPARPADPGRPVSMAQAQRLASIRLHNQQDGRSGFRATIGTPGSAVHLTGWIDWRQPLLYAASVGDHPGPGDGLVEAVPDLLAARLQRLGDTDHPYQTPPAQPPADGWRARRLTPDGPAGSPFDSLFALLFSMRASGPDDATAIAATGARYLRRDLTAGIPVDVVTGPAALPSPTPVLLGPRIPQRVATAPGQPSSAAERGRPSPSGLPFAGQGGQVTYWLDDQGRLRRLDAWLRKDLPVRVDFARDDTTSPPVIGMLGGAPVAPRPVTAAEAQLLAKLATRDRSARGGRLTIEVPVEPAGLIRADGWVDWRAGAGYLAVRNPDDPSQDRLVWTDRTGVATRIAGASAPTGGGLPASPRTTPSPVPTSPPPAPLLAGQWQWATHGSTDLEVLLGAALAPAGGDDPAKLRPRAWWLRTDTVEGVPVAVYELHGPDESGAAPGAGRLRYWLDRSGLLRRIEVRTGDHAYGWLTVTPAPVPALTPPR